MYIKKLFLFLFISTALFSCKKETTTPAPSILGKWTLQSEKEKVTAPGSTPTETTTPANGQTVEFKADGIVAICLGAQCYNLNYKVEGKVLSLSETTDFTNAQVLEIQTLNSTSLVLYQKSTETVQGDVIVTENWNYFTR
jgi:hypothetical protein